MRRPLSNILANVLAVGSAARESIVGSLARKPLTVAMYDGFGTSESVFVTGRVLQDGEIAPATADQSRWQNLWAMLRRADADPVPHAVVRVTLGSVSKEFTADDEGFFAGSMDNRGARRVDDEWVRTDAELLKPAAAAVPIRSSGRALVPAAVPALLVVSDIDDTVLQSKVTNFLHAVRTIAFGNARTRLPFPGVAAFYQALRRGPSGNERNPIFYVSSSPWNLYDVIKQFLEIQGIPDGPVLLRDVDLGLNVLAARRHHEHKGEQIRRVLTAYEHVPVVLIGDSGQQDPEIYRDVVREFQGRIKAVYIRNVTMNDERSRAIQKLADEVLAAGSSLVMADDTLAAAKHAAEHGLIDPAALEAIGEEKKADEGVTSEKTDAPGARDAGDTPTPTVVVE